ncbi:MAG: type II toxin-antitoxin system VapC family toxin [Verrucomicrobiales bacterium]|jgi:predicted nucleic acid-binding protein|nr:type II toxin-antitoxin system VapC family toxin [Verrucomicrobiales bacterium]
MNYLLDTNVVSELMKPVPAEQVFTWLNQNGDDCHVSAITIGEIEQGLELLPDGAKKIRLNNAYRNFWRIIEKRIMPFEINAARRWSVLTAKHQKLGRRLPTLDSMLEATALYWGMTLVTRNTADFAEADTFNPWL